MRRLLSLPPPPLSQAPSNAICMWSVPPGLRPFAMSMSVVAMHVLGDVPGPPLLGLLQSALCNWRASMSIASSLLLVGAALYWVASRAAVTAVDYRTLAPLEEDEEGGGDEGGGGEAEREEFEGYAGKVSQAGAAGAAAWGGEMVDERGGSVQVDWDESGRLSPERPLLKDG
jgi:hypothetical protein